MEYIATGNQVADIFTKGAARTQAPTATNYDVDSATWADLSLTPLQSAMEVVNLGHEPP
uniref:Uncharacterized protein n=1 Tax=Kalanchoe fedtschenkoi TaxID=63787 RepID=A0A7N0TAR4_KALFE